MNGNQTIDFNAAECIKTMSDWGVNHVHNICAGTVQDLPWGTADWFVYVGATAIVGLVGIGFAAFLIGLGINTMFNRYPGE